MCTEQKRQHGDMATRMDSGGPMASSRNTQKGPNDDMCNFHHIVVEI